jgi:hypothetical protein
MGKTLELTMSTTLLTALGDQADAATRHQAYMLYAVADQVGSSVQFDVLPLHAQKMLHMLGDQFGSGRGDLCQHLNLLAPQPSFWVPYAPGTLRCLRCSGQLAKRLKGTNADRTCDVCGKYSRDTAPFAFVLPAKVVDLANATIPAVVRPPLMVSYGLCSGCQSGEDSTASPNPL